jgi:hypothetical protein
MHAFETRASLGLYQAEIRPFDRSGEIYWNDIQTKIPARGKQSVLE